MIIQFNDVQYNIQYNISEIFTFDLINVKCNVSDNTFLIIDLTDCIKSSNM